MKLKSIKSKRGVVPLVAIGALILFFLFVYTSFYSTKYVGSTENKANPKLRKINYPCNLRPFIDEYYKEGHKKTEGIYFEDIEFSIIESNALTIVINEKACALETNTNNIKNVFMGLRYHTKYSKGMDEEKYKQIRECFEFNKGTQKICPALSNARDLLESSKMKILKKAVTYLPGIESELKKLGWEKHGKNLIKVIKTSDKVAITLKVYDTLFCDADFIYLGYAYDYANGGNEILMLFQDDYFIENGFESLDILNQNLIKVMSNPAFSTEIKIVFSATNGWFSSTCSKDKFRGFLQQISPIKNIVTSHGESRERQTSGEINVFRKEAEKAKEHLEEVKANNTPSRFYYLLTYSKYKKYKNQKNTFSRPYNQGLYITAKRNTEVQIKYYENWKKNLTWTDYTSGIILGFIILVIILFALLVLPVPIRLKHEAEKKEGK